VKTKKYTKKIIYCSLQNFKGVSKHIKQKRPQDDDDYDSEEEEE